MSKLALLRHGHTDWNRQGRIQGHTDIPLAEDAADELGQLQLPAQWQQAALISSPLSRARLTAQIIGRREPVVESALIEMNWGDWEGLRSVDLGSDAKSGFRHIEQWGWDYHAPSGESPLEVWRRLRPWIAQLQTDTLAVCHIGVMRALLARAHNWDFTGKPPFEIKRKRLYILELGEKLKVASPPVIRLCNKD